ncbi:unnamed protein product [Strongylus vulgaris]|uniref:Uncharacterized protein n=1 Tax=Strongylus vulgaris TaxID=40348 RepID=A0A3P7KKP6_STRVU|nr:unnamed protein product [Strongylus vulgaris]
MDNHSLNARFTSPGDDLFFVGGVDFPVPTGDTGGVRFPLSGAFEYGTSPYSYAHGSAFNPVSPFDLKSLNDEDVSQTDPKLQSPKKKISKHEFHKKFR